jgi:uncharacterized membrane protein YdbT with pleckstrin-like domain
MNKLHPGAKWVFRLKGFYWLFFISLFFVGFAGRMFSVIFSAVTGSSFDIFSYVFLYFIIGLVFAFIFAEIYARLSYKFWRYEFTPQNLKIEKGIVWKKYSSIPYERVQNVDLQRGIFARMFGFSSLNIQTAGYSAGPRGMPTAEGSLPAVSLEDGEKIREFLMHKISNKNSRQGL